MSTRMIPLVDLRAQYDSIKSEIDDAIRAVIESQSFIQGSFERSFSRYFCELSGLPYGVGCSNGTTAITLSLRALGIGAGDEVIAPDNTFIGTVEPVIEVGAKLILCDIRPDTYGLDLGNLEKLISPRTRAIIPVHLYGNPEDMDGLNKLAAVHNLVVVEDCAQAHLARYKGRPVGTFGTVGTFSFYPGKNLGAFGDAGFVASREPAVIDRVAAALDHGRSSKYVHDSIGCNARMDGMQAAILEVKARHLAEWTRRRRELACLYTSLLAPNGFKLISIHDGAECVYHLYTVEVSNRERVLEHMSARRVSCGIHYPVPLHRQPALKFLGYEMNDFPVTCRVSERILSLPLYPELGAEAVQEIAAIFLEKARP